MWKGEFELSNTSIDIVGACGLNDEIGGKGTRGGIGISGASGARICLCCIDGEIVAHSFPGTGIKRSSSFSVDISIDCKYFLYEG